MSTVIALGGNMGGPHEVVERFAFAISELSIELGTPRISPNYISEPIGPVAQDAFLNAVCLWDVVVEHRRLLQWLHDLEAKCGRERVIRWGPRTLDLDLLWSGVGATREEGIVVPHPRIGERAFVLRPLIDILGSEYVWPHSERTLGQALELVAEQDCRRWTSD